MITLKNSEKNQTINHKTPPTQHTLTFNAVKCTEGDKVAADYFCEPEGSPWIDAFGYTTVSLALLEPLTEEKQEELRKRLEESINSLKEERYSFFIGIIAEATNMIPKEFGVVGHSSYVPD